MEFKDVKVGMVFDNSQPPHFLYIGERTSDYIKIYPINIHVNLEDEEYVGVVDEWEWEDNYEYLERVDGRSPQRYKVFRELFE